ncbi:hypothetical protein ACHAWF_005714 [Thalassiosira exigua]
MAASSQFKLEASAASSGPKILPSSSYDLDASERSVDRSSSSRRAPRLRRAPAKNSAAAAPPPCRESYRLFQRCSASTTSTEGFSCGEAVATYMRCAMRGGKRGPGGACRSS